MLLILISGKDETTFYITLTIEQDEDNDELDDEDYDEFDLDGSGASGMAGNSTEGFTMAGVTTSGSSSCSKSVSGGSREGGSGSSFYGQCGSSIPPSTYEVTKIAERHIGGTGAAVSTSSTTSDETMSQTISK